MRDGGRQMSDSSGKVAERSPCSIKSMPVPELQACSKCGAEIELWSDEEEASCISCGSKVVKEETKVLQL
jgi:DNA-directed RNA polymerase subunit RPC12/RpoP